MITEKNIFERGMLVSLTMGGYSGRKNLSKEQLGNLPTEIVRGVHDLFEKEFKRLLRDISCFDMETRRLVWHQSVPFPLNSVYFISSTKIDDIIEQLESRKQQREEMIEKAVENYEEAIQIFAEKYPDYYQKAKSKYISKNRFAERFYFKYQFLKISAPAKEDSIISPELYKKEMEKFKQTIDEMKKEVVSTIYQELLETTVRLKKQATDGKPNQRTLNNLNEYLKKIDEIYKDFVDRNDLKKAIKDVKASILGITAEDLRDSDASREAFREGIAALVEQIKVLPDIPLKRAITF